MKKLNDDELEEISGGFREDNTALKGISYGMNIECPVCGLDGKEDFSKNVYVDYRMQSAEYICRNNHSFVLWQGGTIVKSQFIKKCLELGYEYKD